MRYLHIFFHKNAEIFRDFGHSIDTESGQYHAAHSRSRTARDYCGAPTTGSRTGASSRIRNQIANPDPT